MIFVSVGTSKYPFPRLVQTVDELALTLDDSVYIQAGSTLSEYTPQNAEYVEYLDRTTYEERIADADLFVTHAGTGSILMALRNDTPTIVVPRRGSEGEHVDDQQLETARGWERRIGLPVAWTVEDLADRLREDSVPALSHRQDDQKLHASIQRILDNIGREGPITVVCPTPPGGHLTQLLALTSDVAGHRIRYLTWDERLAPDIEGVDFVAGYHTEQLPAPRTVWSMCKTTVQALIYLRRVRPAVILSLGGGAFPVSVAYMGWLLGAKVIHVESMTRFETASRTGRLLYPIAEWFFTQHEAALEAYGPKAKYQGSVV